MLSVAVVNSLTTCSYMRLFAVRLPWPQLKACSSCRARSNSWYHIEDVANAHRGRGGLHRPWATHSRMRLLAVRIPRRRRKHALHAGRAGGFNNKIDDEANVLLLICCFIFV